MITRERLLAALCACLAGSLILLVPLIPANGQVDHPVPSVSGEAIGLLSKEAPSGYVGSSACEACHAQEGKAWRTSHHSRAMASATEETVLGDFNNAEFQIGDTKARFFKDGEAYFIETDGPDGKPTSFRISHTFGWEPLQQYLVTFPDGRVQALPFAWDSRTRDAGGQRWFHVYGEDVRPDDPRHWLRLQQNWNHMCAECHSTAVEKNYDPARKIFHTTFSEISVGCEGCHGPALGHLAWANGGAPSSVAGKGFASMRPMHAAREWTPDPSTGSPANSIARAEGDEVETCARCHSRRSQVAIAWSPGHPIGDTHLPVFLTPDLFEDDGQMKDEVFNDHSFKQSAMYARGVTCSDCHDVHSGRLKASGAQVCAGCHLQDKFASVAHTGHSTGPGAPDCVSCHMPSRTYMQVDVRHDHSFRVPRPDLTISTGAPNACNDCHKDRSATWATQAVENWHGPIRKGLQTYGQAFHLARLGDPAARDQLQQIARDPNVPAVARATAVNWLPSFPSVATEASISSALSDPDALTRVAALRALDGLPLDVRWRKASAALSDRVRIVRLEAALLLADQPSDALSPEEQRNLIAAFDEYIAAQQIDLDRPDAYARLGVFRQRQGRANEAIAAYRTALALEPRDATITVTLSDFYRQLGREAESERILNEALALSPDSAVLNHAYGLSLVRARRYSEALPYLQRAATGDLQRARFAFVYALALQSVGRTGEFDRTLAETIARHPYDVDTLSLLLQRALAKRDPSAALFADRLARLNPDNPELARLASRLKGGVR